MSAKAQAAKWLATWFGAGLASKMPGTMGTLAALPFAWIVQLAFGSAGLFIFSLLVFFIGWAAARVYMAAAQKQDDPQEIVIDEVAGVCLLLSVLPPTWQGYLAGFVLFRFFDIVKPWPVSWADREIKGALGVMFDDMVAGFYPIVLMVLLMAVGTLIGKPELLSPLMAWLVGGHK